MLNGPKTSHLAMAKQTPMKLGVFDFQIRRKAPAHKPPSKIFEACYKPTPTAPMMQSSAKAGPTAFWVHVWFRFYEDNQSETTNIKARPVLDRFGQAYHQSREQKG